MYLIIKKEEEYPTYDVDLTNEYHTIILFFY